MYGTFGQRLMLFLFPATLFAALYAALPYLGLLPPSWRDSLPYAVYLILALGLLLSFHFNRSRVFFVLLLLLAFCWNGSLISSGGEGGAAFLRIDGILVFLLPLNITLFCLMREKGIFSAPGRKRFVFLALQALALMIVVKTGRADAQEVAGSWLHSVEGGARQLPRWVLPLMGGCGVIVAGMTYVRRSLIDGAFLAVLAALAIVYSHPAADGTQTVFLFGAGLILTASVLQDSHNMAYRDELTGVLSRRALNEHLNGLGRRYVIAMLDLDHFKRLNDSYGHDVGDQVLRLTAAKIQSVGGGGRAYRYGGEEFAIVFSGKSTENVLACLEELRASIAAYRFAIRGPSRPVPSRQGKKNRCGADADRNISVTVSIGVAGNADEKKSPREVLVAADTELYRAKQRGRNRISSS